MSKYGAKKTEVDGFVFESKAEAHRYSELILAERAGEIFNLALQPVFPLIVNGKKVGKYIADFQYTDRTGLVSWRTLRGWQLLCLDSRKNLSKRFTESTLLK
jgi:hypothetical protein